MSDDVLTPGRVLKGNIATAGIDGGLSESYSSNARLQSRVLIVTTVCVCLAVLFMSKRDERRARAAQLASVDADAISEELEDADSKAKVSVDRLSVH